VRPLLAVGVQALSRATRWRLLLLFASFTALPALLGAALLGLAVGAPLLHSPQGALWTGSLDAEALVGVVRALTDTGLATAPLLGLALALLLALLLAPWLSGATLAEVTSPGRLGGRALLVGAGAYWGRLARLGLVGLLPLAAGAGLAGLAFKSADTATSHALTATAAQGLEHRAVGLAGLALFATLLTVDAGRAVLAARPRRRSAFLAWVAGTWLVLRRPLQTGLAGAVGPAVGLAVALGLTAARTRLGPAAAPLGVLLALFAAAAVGWGRAVRLGALVQVASRDATQREARRAARSLAKAALRAAAQQAQSAGSPAPPPPPLPPPPPAAPGL
jgi:hypothetical protein